MEADVMNHEDTLFDIALRMAQDLREYADAAQEAGEHIQATDVLLEEFDAWLRDQTPEPPEWVRNLGITKVSP
jgi:hypothetical protein